MTMPQDKKIVVSAAPISGPEVTASYEAGRRAGEEDRAAGVVAAGQEACVLQVRRAAEQWANDHELVGALVERDLLADIAGAQAAHEKAGHGLHLARQRAEDVGVRLLAASRVREAAADQVIGLVNPELVRPTRATDAAGGAGPAPDPPDGEARGDPPPAFRHILERKLPKNVGYAVLAALAGAEGFLNAQSFAATGESSNGSLVLAILVGIGIIGLAHRLGDCAADLLENRTRARGRSPARLAELGLGVPALIFGILGTAAIRARYFAAQNQAHPAEHLSIPTAGLVALAFMLAAAAVAVSMAMRNPFADDIARQDLAIADLRHDHERATEEVLHAQHEVSATSARLHDLLRNVDREYRTQAVYARKCAEAYLDGYCATAGIRVTDSLPVPRPPLLVRDARAWLAAHPVGTLAPPTLPFSSAGPTTAGTRTSSPGQPEWPGPARFGIPDTRSLSNGDAVQSGMPEAERAARQNGTAGTEVAVDA